MVDDVARPALERLIEEGLERKRRRERAELLKRYPDKPWRANFPDVDWAYQDSLDAERGLRAMALAPTIEVCRALLSDERVPLEALNAKAVARYERKPG